jgi:hypothetical protein
MSARAASVGLALAAAVLTSLSDPTLAGDENGNGGGGATRRFGAASGGGVGGKNRRIGNFRGGHLGASSFGDGSSPGQDSANADVVLPRSGNSQSASQPAGGIPYFPRRFGNTETRQWEIGAGVPVDPSYANWAVWGTNMGCLMQFGWGSPFAGMGMNMPGMMSPNTYGGNVLGPSPGDGDDGIPGTSGTSADAPPGSTGAAFDNPTNDDVGSEAAENARLNAERGERDFRSGNYKEAVEY